MSDEKIGDILCELGIISETQLRAALEYQKKNDGRIGEILVALGCIESEDIIIGLSEQKYGLHMPSDDEGAEKK